MHKKVLLLTFILSLFFCSCDAPPVANKGVQKELSNRKVRHISHEDEELFGLIYSEQIISEITIDSINQQVIDSLNKVKGFSFEYINNKNIDQQPQVIGEQMEMFTYNLVRGLDLEANGNYFDSKEDPYYYATKAITDEKTVIGFWLLKIDATIVRQNMPEQ